METINLKRTKVALIAFAFLMAVLLCRVFYIQIICHDEFQSMAISQYQVTIQGLNTGQYYYFIAKEKEDERLNHLVGLLDGKQVENGASSYYVFKTQSFDKIINENLKNNYKAYVIKGSTKSWQQDTALFLWADARGNVFLGEKPKLRSGANGELLAQRASALGTTGHGT